MSEKMGLFFNLINQFSLFIKLLFNGDVMFNMREWNEVSGDHFEFLTKLQ